MRFFSNYIKRIFPGAVSHLTRPAAVNALIFDLYNKKWVVYCKPPFDGTKGVLEYLGRYTHRIAISNHCIVKTEAGEVLCCFAMGLNINVHCKFSTKMIR